MEDQDTIKISTVAGASASRYDNCVDNPVWFCAGHYAGHATRYQRAGSSIAEIQYAFRAL